MKKNFDKQNRPVLVCIILLIILVASFVVLTVIWNQNKANLGQQQQWTSDKDRFDEAFQIAVSDKDNPDKILNIPNLTDFLGKTIDEAVSLAGSGAAVSNSSPVNDPVSGAVLATTINLNNESGNVKTGTPNILIYTNRAGKIVKVTFTCNTFLLGYGSYSFSDMIDNLHIVEKSLNEAGLKVSQGTVSAPVDRSSYTTYDSDGTTVVSESANFDNSIFQNGRNYKWSANLTFDYSIANQKGNLGETIRTVSLTIQ